MGQNAQGTQAFPPTPVICFGPFQLDSRAGELRKHGIRIRLQEQPLQILQMLLERPGEAVLREDIRIRLWPNNTIVEFDHSINAAIKRLRNALCDSPEEPRYIETLARRGYRFIGQLETTPNGAAALEPSTIDDIPPATDRGDPTGQTICQYRVLEQLGSGGMGVVYRAEDLKLGRPVALKFLHQELVSDSASLARFERESRAASALHHPNICSIFGVEEWNGRPIIAMELVEGETLAARLGLGRLSLDQTLLFAIQIADAIDAAHSKGVIHRDLKPENVMLAKSRVKVLDFGVAKTEKSSSDEPGQRQLTNPGVIIGTLHCLSPEQLQGNPADARSDIFAFGLLLYQMLTGQRAFQGETAAAVVGAILHAQPALDEIPEPLRRIVAACLAKDPETRWQSVRDLKRELEWAALPQPVGGAARAKGIFTRWNIAVAACVLVLVLLGLRLGRQPPPVQPVYHVTIPTAKVASYVALSRDGRRIAFTASDESGARRLMLRSLDSDVVQTVAGPTDAASYPFWSPDGQSIGYFRAGSLSAVELASGQTKKLAPTRRIARGGSWGSNGQILVTSLDIQDADAIYAIPESGGEPKQVSFPARGENHVFPQFLPDGQRFLFSVFTGTTGTEELRLGTLGSRETRSLGTIAGNVAVASPEILVFRRAETLLAQRVNARTMALLGEPVTLVDDIRYSATDGYSRFTVSGTGVLAFRRGGEGKMRLRWFDRGGKPLGDIGLPGPYRSFELSRDEAGIAISRFDTALGREQVWHGDMERGPSVRLTGVAETERYPVWSPDGKRLCYIAFRNRQPILVMRDLAGGNERLLLTGSKQLWNPAWSPDGHFVAVGEGESAGGDRILLVAVETPGRVEPLLRSEGVPHNMPQFSPDGRWIAYVSQGTGGPKAPEVYVRPFPDVSRGKWLVSDGGGVQPRWRGDGREILYLDPTSHFVAVPVKPQGTLIQVGKPARLFTVNSPWLRQTTYQYAVSRDGQRILAVVPDEEDNRGIEMLIHWDTLLK